MGNLGNVVKKHKEGTAIDIFVNAGSKKNIFPAGFDKWRKRIDIKVASPPTGNKANFDIIKTIATYFELSVKNVWIISGKTSKEKTVLLKTVSVNAASKKLKESLDGL